MLQESVRSKGIIVGLGKRRGFFFEPLFRAKTVIVLGQPVWKKAA